MTGTDCIPVPLFPAEAIGIDLAVPGSDMHLLQIVGITEQGVTIEDLRRGYILNDPAECVIAEAIMEIYRRLSAEPKATPRILSPKTAAAFLIPKAAGLSEEVFGMVALNAKGDVIGDVIVSKGSCRSVVIPPREFFRAALKFGATSAIAWHNHPSGNPAPSREDVLFTKKLRESGESLGVTLADHVIVAGCTMHSFRAAEGWDHQG